jgi:putative spermidine/putrescine transport system ATP-binding protein
MPEIELVDVSKSFGNLKAIDHLNLLVRDREYFSLIGPTGHGKTTTLKLIAGLLKPDEGDIYIDGMGVTDLPPEDRGVGFVFETFSLFPHYDVLRNVIYGPQVRDEDPERSSTVAEQLLEMVLLEQRAESYPHELSGGMKQRIALARALATGSKLLLLDEPYGSLDAKIRMALRNEVRMMVEHLGLTAIHVTNDTEEAMTISDRMGILRKGHIIQVNTPEELYNRPESLFAASFLGESNFFEGKIKNTREDEEDEDDENNEEDEEEREGSFKVEIGGGEVLKMPASVKWERGDRVVLAVKVENVEVIQDKVEKVNAIGGTIERSQFIHGFRRYEIQSDTGKNIVAWTYAVDRRGFKLGSEVTVSFNPERIIVFPHPEEGVEKAISFE